MHPHNVAVIAFLLSMMASTHGQAAGYPAEKALPGQACADGWRWQQQNPNGYR